MSEDDNNTFEISRRKTLAALGTIGAASAGAGLGTSAWFSDTETFEGNTITAGSLDLKVDWQQTYNGPHPQTGEVGWHPVNAYPDDDDDGWMSQNGIQYAGGDTGFDARTIIDSCCDCGDDEFAIRQGGETYCVSAIEGEESVEDFYDYADYHSQNLDIQDPGTSHLFFYQETDGPLSLVLIHDSVEGETGGVASMEVSVVGQEMDDLDWWEQDDPIEGRDDYQKTDSTLTADWIWDQPMTDGGILQGFEDQFCLEVTPGFNEDAAYWEEDSGEITSWTVFDGETETEIDLDLEEPLWVCTDCGIDSGEELPEDVFTSDLYPDQEHLIEFADLKPGDKGEVTFSLHLCDNPGYIWMNGQLVSASENGVTEPEAAAEGEEEDVVELLDKVEVTLWYDTDCDNELGGEEEIIAEGISLRDALDALSQNGGLGIPLDGDRSTAFDELEDAADSENRDPFENSTTQCIGFEWELPGEEVGNEIQTDSAVFDLGFYTEQARHNDGAGIAPEGNNTTTENNETEVNETN
ncbi:SipW-dependent-type signal peptide-containing protein [Halodesulfurarchaeum sp. HSR-GB]|uniref:SipW-dependent-type signal peptide-containing protein n=1 Tax=Halodesulfurarchaeum sp. HSR-GB TaxID=3074077 RepID=UPI0037C0F721